MAFRLKHDESVTRGLRRLARKQLKSAAKALGRGRTPGAAAIHDARRDVKKTRAILAILELDRADGIGHARARLRKASRALSRLRDAAALVQTFDALHPRASSTVSARTLGLVRSRLMAEQRAVLRGGGSHGEIRKAARSIRRSRRSVDRWTPRHKHFRALASAIEAGLTDGRRAMATARRRGRAADFHEWRKAAKRLWYEIRLLEACGGRVRGDARALDRLETWLGRDHDEAVLSERVFGDAQMTRACADLDALRRVVERYQRHLRTKALALGAQIYAKTPKRYAEEVRRLWRKWRDS